MPLRLKPLLEARLDEMGLDELNETVEVPLIDVLADLEFDGIRVDPARLAELSARYGAAAQRAGDRDRRAGRPPVQHRLAQAARRRCCSRS